MNRRIGQLFAALAVALVALIVMTSYWQIWARGSLEARQANTRQVYRDLTIDRGSIVSADGVTLATSARGATGVGCTAGTGADPRLKKTIAIAAASDRSRFRFLTWFLLLRSESRPRTARRSAGRRERDGEWRSSVR